MIFSQCQDLGHLFRVFPGHFGRCRHLTYLAPYYTHNQIFTYRYSPRTSLVRRSTTSSKERFTPSPEQQAIVELCRTQNVVVSARPGAGKTATAEAIVAADPNRHIAVVTYSKRLQVDTARRLSAYPGGDVFTFHGLAGHLFSTTAHNDSILRSLRKQGNVPAWTGARYEIVILDELQDCTDDLFWLVCAFISAVTDAAGGKAPQVVVLGDERQAIYAFRGADARYLSLSSAAMTTLSPYTWNHLALSESFRLSHENCSFVNKVFLGGEEYIIGSHDGPRPMWLYGNIRDTFSLSRHLVPLIRKYGPECTAIIAPSVRQNPALSSLTNHLSEEHGLPIAVLIADDIPLGDKVLQGKICVSTYHAFKGNERDLVIVYGVDAGYFDFLARDLPDDTCPNTTFVALTRARKQLVVVHDNRNDLMPFMDIKALQETSEFVDLEDGGIMPIPAPLGRPLQLGLLLPTNASASDMSRHVLDEEMESICTRHLQIHQVQPPLPDSLYIDAPSTVVTDAAKKHHEAVSDLNGLAVVAAYEHALLGTLTSIGATKKLLARHPFPSNTEAQAIWLCREACIYEARFSGYKSRYLQMKGHSFAWLSTYLNAAKERLEAQFMDPVWLDFEVKLDEQDFCVANPRGGEDQTTFVSGRADIIHYEKALKTSSKAKAQAKWRIADMDLDHVSIWEIKFVAKLSLQHAIQACVYAHLWSQKHGRPTPPRIILFNIRDGEKWDIVPRDGVASLRRVVEETLVAKYTTKDTLTTDEFLEKCAKAKAEVEKSFVGNK